MVVIQAIRSMLFYALFWVQTVPLAIVVGLGAAITGRRTRFGWAVARYWIHSHLWALRTIVGLRSEVTGIENIPDGPCIIAAKHMSDWDVFALLPVAGRPAFIAKKELMDIPFFGTAARSFDTIRIDRSLGAEAIPAMLADARAALDRGARIIIFPEGTRRAPLAPPDYRQGVVRLYQGLNVPVVPVALNSGLFWGRNSPLLWPGTARALCLPAIPPGLDAATFRAQLETRIEAESNRLLAEAFRAGLRRPLSPLLRTGLERLAAAQKSPPDTTS